MRFRLCIDKDRPEEVVATVHERSPLTDEIERLVLQEEVKDQIPGYSEDGIQMLELVRIECFIVENEKTYAIYADGRRFLVRKRLYELEELMPGGFVRISKSALANWNAVARLKVQMSGAVDAVFRSGYTECISRRCFAELKRRYRL